MTKPERLEKIIAYANANADPPTTPALANQCEACKEEFTGVTDFCRPCWCVLSSALVPHPLVGVERRSTDVDEAVQAIHEELLRYVRNPEASGEDFRSEVRSILEGMQR